MDISTLEKQTYTEFTEVLASSAAVPGGGGASALAGAVGIALGHMVGALTAGKKRYADVEADIQALMRRAETLRLSLLHCVTEDAEAFEPLSRAYGIPKDDPDRAAILEKCLRDAAQPPLHVLELCCEALEVLDGFAEKGSKLMISDAATGAALCRGALYGAAVNVRVNTRLMKDRDYAEQMDRLVGERLDKYAALADRIYESVCSRLQ